MTDDRHGCLRFRGHRCRPGRRGGGLQGARHCGASRRDHRRGAGSAASCPHIGCLPSKSLLHAAARHAAGGDYPWSRASAHRDYMVNRPADAAEPDDASPRPRASRTPARRSSGAVRGSPPAACVEVDARGARPTGSAAATSSSPSGPCRRCPPIPGLDATDAWTNREATLARELPRSLLVLGGGPTGCELAQVYARFGVPTTIVQSGPRLAPTDHPRNSEAIRYGAASGTASRSGRASGR